MNQSFLTTLTQYWGGRHINCENDIIVGRYLVNKSDTDVQNQVPHGLVYIYIYCRQVQVWVSETEAFYQVNQ